MLNMESRSSYNPNEEALHRFIRQPVADEMITYLANAASNVILCDPTMMPPPVFDTRTGSRQQQSTQSRSQPPRTVQDSDSSLPPLRVYIYRLVRSSNVQVPTLMSTLVYLNRLKSRLQPMAKGLRCTTHRIFLASLILAAKYLNDSSPKNKHWASYSVIRDDQHDFGFSRTEVNLMEKQLLHLLDWDLRITQEDLYRELEPFLAPIRQDVEAARLQKQRRAELAAARQRAERDAQRDALRRKRKESSDAWVKVPNNYPPTATVRSVYPSPPSSRSSSLSPPYGTSARDVSPPGLSSSASSYAGSLASSRMQSRSTTPQSELGSEDGQLQQQPYIYDSAVEAVEAVMGARGPPVPAKDLYMHHRGLSDQLLFNEIPREEYQNYDQSSKTKRMRGVLGRYFGNGVAVR